MMEPDYTAVHDYVWTGDDEESGVEDMVNRPPHYRWFKEKLGIETLDVTELFNFNLGNVLKYVFRHEHKNGVEDLEKARVYLEREIYRLGGRGSDPILDQKMAEEAVDLDEPQVWQDLRDVPSGVVFTDEVGDKWKFDELRDLLWQPDGDVDPCSDWEPWGSAVGSKDCAPFTEVKETP